MLNVLVGVVYIAFSITIIGVLSLDFLIKISILSSALLVIGFIRILNGFFIKKSNMKIRISKVVVGFILFGVGIVIFSLQNLTDYEKIIIAASGLILNSVLRIFEGFLDRGIEFWMRLVLIVIGIVTLVVSVLVLIVPNWEINTFMILLAISLAFTGIARVFYAIKALGMER